MDNGAIPFALFVLPFWAGLIGMSIGLVILVPIAINAFLRIIIDGVLAARRRSRAGRERESAQDIS